MGAACFVACKRAGQAAPPCQVSNASVNFTGQLSAGGEYTGGGDKREFVEAAKASVCVG